MKDCPLSDLPLSNEWVACLLQIQTRSATRPQNGKNETSFGMTQQLIFSDFMIDSPQIKIQNNIEKTKRKIMIQ